MKGLLLSKSLFQLALSCPTKLYYEGKEAYANANLDDPFLASLAEGGFQVGALAKCYFPEGIDLQDLATQEALEKTQELLKRESVVVFEAAFQHGPLLVRTDILEKDGQRLTINEVKAKSFRRDTDSFFDRKGSVSSGWRDYLTDVAFQKHVVIQACPDLVIETSLTLCDKDDYSPMDGLHQLFRVVKDVNGRRRVRLTAEVTSAHLHPSILTAISTDAACDQIFAGVYPLEGKTASFSKYVDRLSQALLNDEKIVSPIGKKCGACEFRATQEQLDAGMRCGFRDCWSEQLGWTEADFDEPTVLDLWNYRRKDELIAAGRAKLKDVRLSDISVKSNPDGRGLSTGQRQWLQVEKVKNRDDEPWVDLAGLKAEMQTWRFPLHFIDFETSQAAIPFLQGQHPYEGVAFQFSHHIVEKDGSVHHAGEYLNTAPGSFPNYDFVRALKEQLSQDQGTIFRYAAHENTYLNMIHAQLEDDYRLIPDRKDLCAFIESITKSTGNSTRSWEGWRNMVDMCDIVKRYYYHPATRGSNSIKHVLPAVLNSSFWLQEKYAQPVYGAKSGVQGHIPSLNFKDWVWIRRDESGKVIDPYQLLPSMFQDMSKHDASLLSNDDGIRDGGAALTAYGQMQFEDMSAYERRELEKALRKYCELDTLAMVMIYEAWRELIEGA